MKPGFIEAIPLSLYIHIPWCLKKCPYCDFNSHAVDQGALPEPRYVDALLTDLDTELPLVWGRTVSSIFIGGGTPSLFSAESFERLLSGVRARLPLRHDVEITLEANPGTVEQARFHDYRALGINRLSLGVQSFDSDCLARLGRIHDGRQARTAVEVARQAGFENLNLDLMFGLPGQSLQGSLDDLATATAFEPQHLSFYQLTLEPNTAFHHSPPPLPDDEAVWAMQQQGLAYLDSAGYTRYEVSAFAHSPQTRCRHNLNYWRFGDYIGIGAGAHGKLTDMAAEQVQRRTRQRHPARYLEAAADRVSSVRTLTDEDRVFEFMLNAWRLTEGFERPLFEQRTGLPWSRVEPTILELIDDDLVETAGGERYRPTTQGQRFLNDVIGRFLVDADTVEE